MGRYEKYYIKAIGIFPNLPEGYVRLAKLYWFKMERPEDAEATYLQALDETSGHIDVLVDLIIFYQRTEQLDKAKIYAEQLLQAFPDNETYQRDFGYLIE